MPHEVKPPVLPEMQASKWLHLHILVDADEMRELCGCLLAAKLFPIGTVVSEEQKHLPLKQFVEEYERYISSLQSGEAPDVSGLRVFFSSALSLSGNDFSYLSLPESRCVIRAARPVVLLRKGSIGFCPLENKFRSSVFGKDAISWGVQFCYPQLFFDPAKNTVEKVLASNDFPNTRVFRAIQHWIREHTMPTPFFVDNQPIVVPMRLGKKCFPWINRHPDLCRLKIKVEATKGKSDEN